ncbi:ArdC family protein [Salipiger profundus]|uniref:ArdC family protein n=1 Tax=Salipiger profundus TaxID=1229727 RepID=UPI0008F29ADD|nr:zincin-like metallopeptidase domain-containing protein [Salipiger profundus]SFD83536.1 Antirestriction protein ArdC [Salipiger profundus]
MAKAKFDVYQHVTDEIIAQIEAGTPPWRKPWTGGAGGVQMPARFNGEDYRGINVLMLWATAASKGYASERWMTYRQAQELGAQVRKGEKSATVVKFGTIERETEEGEEKKVPYCRAYRVFNADQIDGLPDTFYTRPEQPRDLGTSADPELEAFFARTGAVIHSGPEPQAYYDLRTDHIHMPPIETFLSARTFYGTLGHELCHWTGAEQRLDRFKRFSNRTAYAFEELVAEIGACMLGVKIGVEPEFDQSASYVEGWLIAMKGDNRAIFRAASEAQKAVDFILGEAGRSAAEQAA